MINDSKSKEKYRKDDKSFTRNRKLSFSHAIVFMLRKSVKSLQNSLNEFFNQIDGNLTKVTASAYSQARKNISHEIFIDINKEAIIDTVYADKGTYKKYKDLRLLGIDGTRIQLPDSKDIKLEFGTITNLNQHAELPEYSGGLVSILYDLLNDLAIDSKLAPSHSSERHLAEDHIEFCSKNDLIIGDRGYPSYKLFSMIRQKGAHFLFRCSKSSFKEARELFSGGIDSKTVILKRKNSYDNNVPSELPVRFIKVVLDTGEIEVLATSLLDEDAYPLDEFKELYWMRWGVETYFSTLKNRLDLENFTGKTSEAVKQDFYSTIMISNYESTLTADAQEELETRSVKNKYKQKVNKAISFNTIKNRAIDLFFIEKVNDDELIKKMTELFLMNSNPIRRNRSFERSSSKNRSLGYHKRKKKIIF
jgi:hypothetical protein